MTSPMIDLSSQTGKYFHLDWWQWLETRWDDRADLQVSKDGGATWIKVYGPVKGAIDMSWKNHSAGLNPSYAVSNFQFRFHLVTDSEVNLSGWYLDDVRLQAGECLPMAGGLVVGECL